MSEVCRTETVTTPDNDVTEYRHAPGVHFTLLQQDGKKQDFHLF